MSGILSVISTLWQYFLAHPLVITSVLGVVSAILAQIGNLFQAVGSSAPGWIGTVIGWIGNIVHLFNSGGTTNGT